MKRMNKRWLSAGLLAATLAFSVALYPGSHQTVVAKENEVQWSYSGETGPDHWAELNLPDYQGDGDDQSPINITGAKDVDLPKLDFTTKDSEAEVENNGHTIEVVVEGGKDHLNFDGKDYKLVQFHFHNPSENQIDGKTYPLEGHFVFQTDKGETTVVSVLYKEGKENKELKSIWSKMPAKANKEVELSDDIDLNDFLPSNQDYYNFQGSLTTPPCTEGVNWIVFKHQKTISKKQIKTFSDTLGFENARPVQPLNGREIKE